MADPKVPSGGLAAVGFSEKPDGMVLGELFHDRRTVVGGAVIDDNNLVGPRGLSKDAVESLLDELLPVVERNNRRDARNRRDHACPGRPNIRTFVPVIYWGSSLRVATAVADCNVTSSGPRGTGRVFVYKGGERMLHRARKRL